jgi:predicted AAA+ superfamily ATPase
MFYRMILREFEKWVERKNRKPLIIRGARQVGKTTAVNLFAEQFDQYIYLNLELEEDKKLFLQKKDINDLLEAIKNGMLEKRYYLLMKYRWYRRQSPN